ncbi:MAG: TasA family protein [Dehalococcoidia bacterium]
MVRKLAATIAVLAVFVGLMSLSALALFTDTASVPSNTFSTGTVDISTSSDGVALLTFSDMAPGDQVTAPITVSNAGTLELRYAVTSTTTENTLAAQLDLTIKSGVTTCTDAGFGVDGTVLYASADLGSTTGVNGIEVRVDWWLDSTLGNNKMRVELSWDGGTSWTAAKTDSTETTAEHTTILGSAADTWGRTWIPADLSDANFRVRIETSCSGSPSNCDPRDFFLDWLPVRATYSPP